MKFSPRLAYVVNEVPLEASVIDIAADHGYVALDLMRKNPERKIIISDIAEQPLAAGKKNFLDHGLQGDFRLGSGVTVLANGEKIDYGIIAGVGGKLMVELFEEEPIKMRQVQRFILSANVGMELVRRWAYDHNFAITKDVVIQDGIYFYETITLVADVTRGMAFPDAIEELMVACFFGANIEQKLLLPDTHAWLEHTRESLLFKLAQIRKGTTPEAKALLEKYTILVSKIEEWLV